MSGLSAKYDDKAWQAYLQRAGARATDLSPAMRDVRAVLDGRIRTTFATATDPWGEPWAPWAIDEDTGRTYVEMQRERRGIASDAMLIASEKLYESLQSSHDATSVTFTVGSNESGAYADVHQFGNDHVPARPYFPITEQDSIEFPMEWFDDVVLPLNKYIAGAFQ